MIFTDPNTSIIFSRSCADLIVSDLPDDCREVSLNISSEGQESEFTVSPYGGKIVIRLSEILRGLEADGAVNPVLVTDKQTYWPKRIDITATADDGTTASWHGYYMPGGVHLSAQALQELLSGRYWWTFRKQSTHTFRFGKELLSSRLSPVRITFHFADAGKVSSLWYDGSSDSSSDPDMMIIDCSYRKVRAYADSLGYANDTIIAYDIAGNSGNPVGQRFIVAPNDSRVKGWCFRNSLGCYDTVYSFGPLARSIDSEVKTFIAERTAKELENFSEEIWNINTGYIADSKELDLWYEFLRSRERYYILEDGALSKILVDESDSESQVGRLGNLSFKCRFAKETEGYDFTRSVLEDFSDEYT